MLVVSVVLITLCDSITIMIIMILLFFNLPRCLEFFS